MKRPRRARRCWRWSPAAGRGERRAGLPPPYGADASSQPAGAPERYEFDLDAARCSARGRENKRLYVYLGASDCPFCRKYEAFLDKNADALVPHFAKDWLVVDLRSSLKVQADRLHFRIGAAVLDLRRVHAASSATSACASSSTRASGCSTARRKPLMQMPAGTGTFETVPEQLEILRLEQ